MLLLDRSFISELMGIIEDIEEYYKELNNGAIKKLVPELQSRSLALNEERKRKLVKLVGEADKHIHDFRGDLKNTVQINEADWERIKLHSSDKTDKKIKIEFADIKEIKKILGNACEDKQA